MVMPLCKAVKTTISAIVHTLEELSEGNESTRAVEARGLISSKKNPFCCL